VPRQQPGEPPKYQEIADKLRRQIGDGTYPPGSLLPPERKIAEQEGVAVGTARRALAVLRDEGITEARVGAGVYVRTWRPIVRNALKRLSSSQWGEGRSIWDVDIDDRRLDAVDVQIDLEDGAPVWRRNRRYLVDGVAVMRSTSYIPDDLASGTRITQVDSGPGGTYARLRETGNGPVKFREELRCRMPSAAEVDDLELKPGTPVVELCRTAMRNDGRVVEVNRMILDASRYLLVYDFPA
jgi:GntR family transcriptional regulator